MKLIVSDCWRRFTPRWSMNFYIEALGGRCLDGAAQGRAALFACGFGINFQWTYTERGQLRRAGTNLCLQAGGLGTQPAVTTCLPGNENQRFFLVGPDDAIVTREGCLGVDDNPNPPVRGYAVNPGTPFRVQECNGKLTQKFAFRGFIQNAPGMCIGREASPVPQNGRRTIIDSCASATVPFFTYYFGNVQTEF